MLKDFIKYCLFVAVVLFAAQTAVAQTSGDGATTVLPVYAVEKYDPARDPATDLQEAVTRATAENRRILLFVGGNWCPWCRALDRYVRENQAVASALAQDFLVMKVNFSEENENKAFLGKLPEVPGYPHWFVLEKDGTLLHSQGTGDFEAGKAINDGYSEAKILAFLKEWAPKP